MNNNKWSHIDGKASRTISLFGGILHLTNWALTILLKASIPGSWVTDLDLFKAIPIIPKTQRAPMEKEWRQEDNKFSIGANKKRGTEPWLQILTDPSVLQRTVAKLFIYIKSPPDGNVLTAKSVSALISCPRGGLVKRHRVGLGSQRTKLVTLNLCPVVSPAQRSRSLRAA